MASAAVKRFHDEGQRPADLPLAAWSCELALWKVQEALVSVHDNLPHRWAGWLLRILIFPFGARLKPPADALGGAVARDVLDGGEAWVRLTRDIFVPTSAEQGLGSLDMALDAAGAAKSAARKIRDGIAQGHLDAEPAATLAKRALLQGIIDCDEGKRLVHAVSAADAAIAVDAYGADGYARLKG